MRIYRLSAHATNISSDITTHTSTTNDGTAFGDVNNINNKRRPLQPYGQQTLRFTGPLPLPSHLIIPRDRDSHAIVPGVNAPDGQSMEFPISYLHTIRTITPLCISTSTATTNNNSNSNKFFKISASGMNPHSPPAYALAKPLPAACEWTPWPLYSAVQLGVKLVMGVVPARAAQSDPTPAAAFTSSVFASPAFAFAPPSGVRGGLNHSFGCGAGGSGLGAGLDMAGLGAQLHASARPSGPAQVPEVPCMNELPWHCSESSAAIHYNGMYMQTFTVNVTTPKGAAELDCYVRLAHSKGAQVVSGKKSVCMLLVVVVVYIFMYVCVLCSFAHFLYKLFFDTHTHTHTHNTHSTSPLSPNSKAASPPRT